MPVPELPSVTSLVPSTPSISDAASATYVQVALDAPLHAVFDYAVPVTQVIPGLGSLVEVPFGTRSVVGVVVGHSVTSAHAGAQCKDVAEVYTDFAPLNADWRALCQFAAHYYLRGVGEVMVPAIPAPLRESSAWARWAAQWQGQHYTLLPAHTATLAASLSKRAKGAHAALEALQAAGTDGLADEVIHGLGRSAQQAVAAWVAQGWVTTRSTQRALLPRVETQAPSRAPALHAEQSHVVQTIGQALANTGQYAPFLLHGVTGSGKTETYLQLIAQALEQDAQAQILLLVPEINLTPQLEATVRGRFPQHPIATLHSGMAEGERCRHWLAAHLGEARIVLGTRLAILASLPALRLIVVDEEHDASYKQQEGLRYSARDLALWRAKQRKIPVVLGSATPSLESWQAAQQGRYTLLTMTQRARSQGDVPAALPPVRLINLGIEAQQKRPSIDGLSQPLREAIAARLAKGEQSLLYLNRRGYAPVLQCGECGWLSGCPRCSAHLVWHRQAEQVGKAFQHGALRCHHCGYEVPVPRHCPDCGNLHLAPLGRGTQKIEETLASLFPQARIARIDADSTRRKGSAESLFGEVHAGEVDILVGTQMVAKGHDFQRVTLVGIVNPDAALFSHDFRASERLFAQLMQVSGRAGRAGLPGEVFVQTRYPEAAVYQALQQHDYVRHANQLLAERKSAVLPPFGYQALLTVEAASLEKALAFLHSALALANALEPCGVGSVVCHDPVPRTMVRVARRERAQLLIESSQRQALQAMLDAWLPQLAAIRPRQAWQLERDPAGI